MLFCVLGVLQWIIALACAYVCLSTKKKKKHLAAVIEEEDCVEITSAQGNKSELCSNKQQSN